MSIYRTIPIFIILLEYYKDLYDDCSSYYNFNDNWNVFCNIDTLPETTLRDRKTKNVLKVGVKHDLRHSCASLLINTGQPVTTVSKYLGHAISKETLDTYAHMFPNNLTDVKNTMDNLNLSI